MRSDPQAADPAAAQPDALTEADVRRIVRDELRHVAKSFNAAVRLDAVGGGVRPLSSPIERP